MRKGTLACVVTLIVLVLGVPAALARDSGTLTLSHANLTGTVNQVDCPPGTSSSTACFQSVTQGLVRGLGLVSERNFNFVDDADSSCERWHSNPVVTVRGKGDIDLSVHQAGECVVSTTGTLAASVVFTVTGGTGIYAGASGSGSGSTHGAPGYTNRQTDTFSGTLTVSGLEFDVTPPVLVGATSKVTYAPRNAKVARVSYAVTARDAGHGAVPVTCKPRSGSTVRVGRTSVTCSATDSSGNTAAKKFVVTVKRRR